MKPDKFDIMQSVIWRECRDGNDTPIMVIELYGMMALSNLVYNNYDESLTLEQNIEKYVQ